MKRHLVLVVMVFVFGFSVSAAEKQAWIEVSADGKGFVKAGTDEAFLVWGVNYDHANDQRLIEDFWRDLWPTVVEDFGEIKALGANTVRIHLQFGRFMKSPDEPNKAELRRLKKVVKLAEGLGLYLDVTGLGCYHKQDIPAWYDALSEEDRWAAQANFWRAVAGACADSSAIFCYDLMNEPVLAGKDPAEGYLVGEPLGGKYFVQRIALEMKGRSRNELAKAWVDNLVGAIREVDERHMITVGVIPWAHTWPNAKPLFYSEEVGANLDFASVHFYPRKGEVDKALAALKVYEVGKPLVIEEMFPLKSGFEEMDEFIEGSREITDGWISFYWGRTIEDYQEGPSDFASAIMAKWLEYYRDKGREILE
jgi:hypothetical protein